MAVDQDTRPEADRPDAAPPRRRSGQRTRLWGTLLALPTAWIVGFFVSSMVIVVLLSFGRTQDDGRPVFGTTLANYDALLNEVYLRLFLRSLTYAVATTLVCALIAYPVAYAIALYEAGAVRERVDRGDRGAVLRQLPDPDVRLVGPALRRGHRQQPPAPDRHQRRRAAPGTRHVSPWSGGWSTATSCS